MKKQNKTIIMIARADKRINSCLKKAENNLVIRRKSLAKTLKESWKELWREQ